MSKQFSRYLKKKKPILVKLLNELLEEYSYVSILATDISGDMLHVDRKLYSVLPTNLTECGVVIKVYHDGIYSEYSLNEVKEKDFAKIKETIHDLVNTKGIVKRREVPEFNEEQIKESFSRKMKGKIYTNDQILSYFKEQINKYLDIIPNVINISLVFEQIYTSKMFLSKNKDLEQFYPWNGIRAQILVRRDETTQYAYTGYGSISQENNLKTLLSEIARLGDVANKLLSSTIPTPGIYDVITDPSITGLIAHEAFGHGVEMDMYVKDRAKSMEYIDKQVASPLITMHDGADATFSCSSYFFDDDGVLAQDTVIIDHGILRRGISDALSALELGTKPTGNGRRETYKRKAYTRMTNTFFEKGTSKLTDMIKSIKHGYLISTTNNGMEDPKNWGIQCTAQYGLEIIDGEFTGKVISPVVMSGYVIDLLNSITAVSNDFNVIGSGSCGKGYKEWVRVSDGGPYLKAKVKIG